MQFRLNQVLTSVLLVASSAVFAEDTGVPSGPSGPNGTPVTDQQLTTYLKNLGEYFGYDITQYCTTGGPCSTSGSGADESGGSAGGPSASGTFSNTLFNENDAYAIQLNLFQSYLGALVGGSASNSQESTTVVPLNPPNSYSVLNTLASQTFINPPYNSTSSSTQGVTASPLIDQQTYQTDPVSQAVLNIIATPNYTYCLQNNSQAFIADCPYLYRELIMMKVIGTLQGTQAVFTSDYNQSVVPQLNSDTLITPLLYSQTATTTNPPSGGTGNNNPGLTAHSQAQQAANFIRYVSNAVNPLSLLNRTDYDNLVSVAENYGKTSTAQQQAQAATQLNNYLTKLRTYAAQSSIPISNFYYILSRRMPQTPPTASGDSSEGKSSGNPSSEALNEFIMASWRLYNPNAAEPSESKPSQQWLNQINQGSAASVQKEIAILLAEINYQLYLSRQLQERMLLNESTLLLTSIIASQSTINLVSSVPSNQSSNPPPSA